MNFEKMYSTIDAHVAGKAFRIVTQSPIRLNKKDIQANNEYLQTHFENEKNLLLNEPRGHRDMHGCIVLPSDVADIGMLFFNHEEQTDFTYSGLIAGITALLETGNLTRKQDGQYEIETAHGIHSVQTEMLDGEVRSVSVANTETTVEQKEDTPFVHVDGKRSYVLYDLPESIPTIDDQYLIQINNWGRETCAHLQAKDMLFDGVILVEERSVDTSVRSVTFEIDGNIVRSPGVDSTIALLASKKARHTTVDELTNESIFGSQLTAKTTSETNRYSVQTEAFVTGLQDFIYDQDDPLNEGFLLK